MTRTAMPTLVLCAVIAVPAAGQTPLRYGLVVGDRLIYERRTTVKALDSGEVLGRSVDQVQLWCLARQDGEHLAVLDLIHIEEDRAAPAIGVLLYIDDRGRTRLAGSSTFAAEIYPALDILPVLRLPPRTGPTWQTPAKTNLLALPRTNTQVGPDSRHRDHVRVDYRVDYPGDAGKILGRALGGSYWFDVGAGLVSRVESWQEDRVTGRRTEAVTLFRRGERNDERWTRRRNEEVVRYQRTQLREDRLRESLLRQPRDAEEALSRLQRLWAGSVTEFDHDAGSPLGLLARVRRKRLAAEAPALRAAAAYAARWLDRPAASWSLETVAGEAVSSDTLRGTPVIECLWSTADPGVFAMFASLEKLRLAVAGTPIHIVYLNLDADVALARRMKPCLPTGVQHVLAGPLRAVDDPPELPVVRVLDAEGIIRQLWLGWQPDYAAAATKARELAE